jgi:hypothetical protein
MEISNCGWRMKNIREDSVLAIVIETRTSSIRVENQKLECAK